MTRSSTGVKVRRMTSEDLRAVNQIDRLLFDEKRVPTWPFSFDTYWNLYGPGVSFVAEVNDRLVGFLAGNIAPQERSHSVIDLMHTAERASRYPKVGFIDMIGILPDFQGKDVGRALVNAFYDECKLNGAPVRAHIKESDETLSRFLAKLGFRKWDTATYEKD